MSLEVGYLYCTNLSKEQKNKIDMKVKQNRREFMFIIKFLPLPITSYLFAESAIFEDFIPANTNPVQIESVVKHENFCSPEEQSYKNLLNRTETAVLYVDWRTNGFAPNNLPKKHQIPRVNQTPKKNSAPSSGSSGRIKPPSHFGIDGPKGAARPGSKPPGSPTNQGRAATGIQATKSSAKSSGDRDSSSKDKSETTREKEARRNEYTRECSEFKDAKGAGYVVHRGQTNFKTKKHGNAMGLEKNEKGKTLSSPENKALFHSKVSEEAKKMAQDPKQILSNVSYTTRNQPTQKTVALYDAESGKCHLFKAELDTQKNHQYVTTMVLADEQRSEIQANNSIGSDFESLHKTQTDEL